MTGGMEGNLEGQRCLVENDQRGDLKIRYGQHTTVLAADDNIATGLSVVLGVTISLVSTPLVTIESVTVTNGTNAGTLKISGWEADLTVATVFGKLVNWIAVGY